MTVKKKTTTKIKAAAAAAAANTVVDQKIDTIKKTTKKAKAAVEKNAAAHVHAQSTVGNAKNAIEADTKKSEEGTQITAANATVNVNVVVEKKVKKAAKTKKNEKGAQIKSELGNTAANATVNVVVEKKVAKTKKEIGNTKNVVEKVKRVKKIAKDAQIQVVQTTQVNVGSEKNVIVKKVVRVKKSATTTNAANVNNAQVVATEKVKKIKIKKSVQIKSENVTNATKNAKVKNVQVDEVKNTNSTAKNVNARNNAKVQIKSENANAEKKKNAKVQVKSDKVTNANVMNAKKNTTHKDYEDPLDAKGVRLNFMNGEPYTADRFIKWSTLPVYSTKESLRQLCKSLEEDRVTIIISPTGSGKSVITPPLALSMVFASDLRVAVTVPKKVLATAASAYANKNLDCEGSGLVGYKFKGSNMGETRSYDEKKCRLLYATDGTLLSESRKDPLLSLYATVIVDEVHERSVHTDLLLSALKDAAAARGRENPLHIVLMSATLDPTPFFNFFADASPADVARALKEGPRHATVGGVGLIEVPGSTLFPIDRRFASEDDGLTTYVADGIKAIVDIVGHPESSEVSPKNVLFFVATTMDAKRGCKKFETACPRDQKRCVEVQCAGIYGKLSKKKQDEILRPELAQGILRKVLFATNVAESSLTLAGFTHVVDSGMQLTSHWDPALNATRIAKGRATRAQVLQRIGRVGRTEPGEARLLYTKATFDRLPDYPDPSIVNVDASDILLMTACPAQPRNAAAVVPPLTLRSAVARLKSMLTPIRDAQIASALAMLHFYGIVTVHLGGVFKAYSEVPYGKHGFSFLDLGYDGAVTPDGVWLQRVADVLRISLWNSMLVCSGIAMGCGQDALVVAVLLEAMDKEGPWRREAEHHLWVESREGRCFMREWFGDDERVLNEISGSDHVGLLRVYQRVFLPLATAELSEIEQRGLNAYPWKDAHRDILDATRRLDELTRARLTNDSGGGGGRIFGSKASSGGRLQDAVLAARRYHLAVPVAQQGKKGYDTVGPIVSTQCTLEKMMARPAAKDRLVYESLLVKSDGASISWVTKVF